MSGRRVAGRVARRLLTAARSRPARWGFGVLTVALAVWAVAAEWSDVRAAAARLGPLPVLLAALATAVNVLLAGAMWRSALADLGSVLPVRVAARVFYLGQLGKYLPGSVWPMVMQAELGADHGVPRRRTATASLVALMLSVASAFGVVLLTLPVQNGVLPARFGWAVVLVVPLAVLLHPRVLGAVVDRALAVAGREPLEHRTSTAGTLRATGWAAGSWVGAGLQVWVLAVALGMRVSPGTAALAIGGYCLAWAVGFVFVIAPAGAGVRELALAAVLAGELGRGEVLVVVLVSRVLFTAADLVAAGLALLGARRELPARTGTAARS